MARPGSVFGKLALLVVGVMAGPAAAGDFSFSFGFSSGSWCYPAYSTSYVYYDPWPIVYTDCSPSVVVYERCPTVVYRKCRPSVVVYRDWTPSYTRSCPPPTVVRRTYERTYYRAPSTSYYRTYERCGPPRAHYRAPAYREHYRTRYYSPAERCYGRPSYQRSTVRVYR